MKIDRAAVLARTDGRCGYCGCQLAGRWHVDHMEPVIRNPSGGHDRPNDSPENLMPACPSCNLYKSFLTVEEFRRQIAKTTAGLRRDSTAFKFAERFGLVAVNDTPVAFYFEARKA